MIQAEYFVVKQILLQVLTLLIALISLESIFKQIKPYFLLLLI